MESDFEYSAVAIEHARNPRNYGPLEAYDGHARITGPCGDTMEFWLRIRDGRIVRATFTTDGCGPSLACGSMATELTHGKTVEEAGDIHQEDILDALGGFPEEVQHCALLAANTLHAACNGLSKDSGGPGLQDELAKQDSCDNCESSSCSAKAIRQGESEKGYAERRKLQSRLCRIGHKILVLSGKGGVGKSTVAVHLALSLTLAGKRVGLLDVDIHGPSVPTMLGLEGVTPRVAPGALVPVELGALKVMSIGFLLRSRDDAVIWRGPIKMGVIKQFLKDVEWGDLDYLIIDSPPGTGDEPLSVCQLIENADGAVVVTTPQRVATVDVRKAITFCRKLNLPVLGVVENMSGFVCPTCGESTAIFQTGGGERMAAEMDVPFLGSIPIDPKIVEASDSGKSRVRLFPDSAAAEAFGRIVRPILDLSKESFSNSRHDTSSEKSG